MKRPRLALLVLLVAALGLPHCSGGGDSGGGGGGGGGTTPPPAASNRWTTLGQNLGSTYHNEGERTLSTSNAASLREAWRLTVRGVVSGAAAVADGTAYVLATGGLYALDARTGSVRWENAAIAGFASPTLSEGTLFVTSATSRLHAVDPATGTERWQAQIDPHPFAAGYSSPVVSGRFVLVGSSSNEELNVGTGATFRGGVVAYDRSNGQEIWRYYTVNPPLNGASVWSTVSVDEALRLVFVTTGNTYTGDVSASTADAIIALELETGRVRWTRQLTADDIFTIPNQRGPDYDFGANAILFEATIGGARRRLVGAGQKSGVFHALDRETGAVVWQRQVSPGHFLTGGVINNGAFDGQRILVAGNRGTSSGPGSEPSNGTSGADTTATLMALDPATGNVLWERQLPAFVWAPITVANGVGFVAVNQDLQAFRTDNGQRLFTFPTAGTITSAPVVADGRVYFGSGIVYFTGTPNDKFHALSLDAPAPTPTPGPTPTPTPGGGAPTFTNVYNNIIVARGCTACHGNQGNLLMNSRQEAYSQLVNVPAQSAPCVGQGRTRVVPGNPDASLLVDKVSRAQPACGLVMPPSGPLGAADIQLIRDWITNGARND